MQKEWKWQRRRHQTTRFTMRLLAKNDKKRWERDQTSSTMFCRVNTKNCVKNVMNNFNNKSQVIIRYSQIFSTISLCFHNIVIFCHFENGNYFKNVFFLSLLLCVICKLNTLIEKLQKCVRDSIYFQFNV